MDQVLQDKLRESNILFLHPKCSDDDINQIVFSLMAIAQDNPKAEIQLYIAGSFEYGRAMPVYDAIRSIPNPVFGVAIGAIGAFSVLILCACSTKAMLPHSRLYFSEPYGVLDAGANQQTEVVIAAKQAQLEAEEYVRLLAKYTGKDLKTIEKDVEEGKRFSPEEAKEYGLIDTIIQ